MGCGGAGIGNLQAAESRRWEAGDARLAPAVEAIARLAASGGKRLRALFAYWAFTGAGGDPDSPIIVAAGAALALIHLAALLHDYATDASSLRRRAPTLRSNFAGLHRRRAGPRAPQQAYVARAIALRA